MTLNPDLDLTISRIIKAPREAVWSAWTDPVRFAQWWIPAPAKCQVDAMELRPGGAFITRMSENGAPFEPRMQGCFLAVDSLERVVFTTALIGGFRPVAAALRMTAIVTFAEHESGTMYAAHVMHESGADRDMHDQLGFQDGWGTVIAQLAKLVEQ